MSRKNKDDPIRKPKASKKNTIKKDGKQVNDSTL
jgi:hypothetical protein